ncbi:MAG: thioredoxin-dependent thiol peroxidase [Candidatus Coatesbacteria bacterium]|nr:thioredoxin-dependent thiol peroxidase [Candidatus Coatesbacteria bacterium]
MPEKGDNAPEFCLPNHEGKEVCLKQFKGSWVVLYFYPKDNTSGCTKEALEFTELKSRFAGMGAAIIGISPDSVESHRKFREKHALTISLLSDPEHKVLESYGVWQLKKMYGREYQGVARSTFLIDPEGKVAEVWRKVKVKGHAEAVQCALSDARGE